MSPTVIGKSDMSSRAKRGICFVAAFVVAVAACSGASQSLDPANPAGLPSCPPGTAIFTVSPIAVSNIAGWVPLGNLSPPAHTFPTDHQYIYLPRPAAGTVPPVELLSPGSVVITRARRTQYNTGNTDYSLEFSPCAEVHGEFGHVTTIAPGLLAKLGAFTQGCSSYSPAPGTTVTSCYTENIAVPASAGEVIGSTAGLDVSLWDRRVTPLKFANASRWRTTSDGFDYFHVVAASDYFAEPAMTQIAPKVGSFDGRTRRTAAPVGGTIEVDVAGSAQGAWFHPTQPGYPESPHFAIVPDNVDPSKFVFSFGTTQSAVSGRMYTITPKATGLVDRAPSQVTADGQVYCYDTPFFNTAILVRLIDATRLRVEPRTATTCAAQAPFAFTSSAFEYVR
jgi:hypothetical protein